MSRSESFVLGVAVMAVGLTALTVSQRLSSWGLVVIGTILIVKPYFLDWRYGEYRPSRREVGAMSKEEYKKRLRDPKFERYINRLFNGRV
jgi:hypothetical protein